MKFSFKKWLPSVTAFVFGVIALIYYIESGQGNFDRVIRELSESDNIEKIETGKENEMTIMCKNGERYKIKFRKKEKEYGSLVFNNCDGMQEKKEAGM